MFPCVSAILEMTSGEFFHKFARFHGVTLKFIKVIHEHSIIMQLKVFF